MVRFLIVSVLGGIVFGALDGLINGNPLARALLEAYGPIARTSVNVFFGVAIDLAYGFALAGIFLLLRRSLPGRAGWTKGLSFGLITWFLRVAMQVASQWMTLEVPGSALAYMLFTGLCEMLVLGLFYGLTLRRDAVEDRSAHPPAQA